MEDSLLNEMLIVVDVWIVYWWCEGNIADYRYDVCQVQKENYCCFGLEKQGCYK